jgi:hypothetical protein
MSKRTRKDIKTISSRTTVTEGDTARLLPDPSLLPSLSIEPAAGKKNRAKKYSKTAVIEQVQDGQDDPELQDLLFQVDSMLTEMTQSKWLSSDWPSLEIDFGNNKK